MGKLSSGLELFRSYRSKALPKPRKEMFSKIRSLFKSPWKDSFDLDIGFMNRRFDSTLKRPPGVRNELLLLYRVLGLPLSEQEKGEVFTASQKYVRDIAQPQLSFIRFYARCVDLVPNKKRRMTIRQVKHPISRHATMCFDEVSFGSEPSQKPFEY
jgi:hypothetical protein